MQAMDIKSSAASAYFRVIGSLLRTECTESMLQELIDSGLFDELPYESTHPLVLRGQKRLIQWLNSAPKEYLAERACNDYMRLFVGPGKLLAPPWGSAYLTCDRLLFQRETLWVREYYERNGLELAHKYAEPDDHIGLELIFLSFLAETGEKTAMEEFITDHMLTWAERWHADVEYHSETDFYKALADMALGSLTEFTAK